jgi:hypothetical protein
VRKFCWPATALLLIVLEDEGVRVRVRVSKKGRKRVRKRGDIRKDTSVLLARILSRGTDKCIFAVSLLRNRSSPSSKRNPNGFLPLDQDMIPPRALR